MQDKTMIKKRLTILLSAAALCCFGQVYAQLLPYPIDTIDGQAFYRYEVEKSVGLYRVSKTFEVTQEELIQWNPEVEKTGLRYGETVLRIPVRQQPLVQPQPAQPLPPQPVVAEEPAHAQELPAADTVIEPLAPVSRPVRKLALLLPLQVNAIQRDAQMDRFFDFYEGVLLAIHDLQSQEQPYELHVFDIGKAQTGVQKLVESKALAGMDAVIGPAYPAQVLVISDWAKQDSVPVLVPFIDKVLDLKTNPFLLQFNSPEELEAEAMLSYLRQNRDSIHCVIVDAQGQDGSKQIRLILEGIREEGISHATTTVRNILADSIALALQQGKENILIFNAQKYGNIQFLMPRILNTVGTYKLCLMSQYSWQEENIIIPQIFVSDFAAVNPIERENYEIKYAHLLGNEHAGLFPRYDMLGYDLTRQLVAWMEGKEYHGIQSDIQWQRVSEEGGLQNIHIEVVRK